MAIISLSLTVANVVMVALGSALMFRAKEVLQVKKKVFWDDLQLDEFIQAVRFIQLQEKPWTFSQVRFVIPVHSSYFISDQLIKCLIATTAVKRQYAEQSENSRSCQ